MEIQVGLWWWKWKPLKLSKSPHAGDWWLDDFGHDDDNGDDSADDDGDDNDDDDDEKEEEVAKLDTIGRRDVSQTEL